MYSSSVCQCVNFLVTDRFTFRYKGGPVSIHVFLALLDSVSRAYSKGILSVVRLWYRLSLKLLHEFLSNFNCGFLWAIRPDFFFFFSFLKKKVPCLIFYDYFSFSFTWNPRLWEQNFQNATTPSNHF